MGRNIALMMECYSRGGLDTFIENLVQSWPCKESKLTLFVNDTHPGIDYLREKLSNLLELRIYTTRRTPAESWLLDMTGISRFGWTIAWRLARLPIMFPVLIYQERKRWSAFSFDALIVINGGHPGSLRCQATTVGWWIAHKRKVCLYTVHSMASAPRLSSLDELVSDYLVSRCATYTVTVSKASLEALRRRIAFGESGRIGYVYNGLRDPLKERGVFSCQVDRNSDRPEIVLLSTLHAYKGHAVALEAMKTLVKYVPNARLNIYGSGSGHEKKQIEKTIQRLGISGNVRLHGHRDNTREVFLKSDILISTSLAHEAFGYTVIEAMAFGIPVVVSDTGGPMEIVKMHNSGLIYRKNDPHALGQILSQILLKDDTLYTMGVKGRKSYSKNFESELMCASYYSLITGRGFNCSVAGVGL